MQHTINIQSKTPATLTINSLGNYIIRGNEIAQNVKVNENQIGELLVLERQGFVKIIYLNAPPPASPIEKKENVEPEIKTESKTEGKTEGKTESKRGRGRPKGAKNKATLEKENQEILAKQQEKEQIETEKVVRNKTDAEAQTDEMGGRVVVTTSRGTVQGKMVNSVVGEAKESSRAEASLKAMEELEAEENNEEIDGVEKQTIDEESLDPSERMGGKAVISAGGDAKKIDLVNSVLPEAKAIRERDPFIDRENKKDSNAIKDSFLEDLDKGIDSDPDNDTDFIEI